jgi:hypothetical protein
VRSCARGREVGEDEDEDEDEDAHAHEDAHDVTPFY